MTHNCARCGTSFTATTKRARFCSNSCRAQASKARRDGRPERVGDPVVVELHGDEVPVGAVRRDLEVWLAARDQTGQPLAAAALALADRIDGGTDALSGLAIAVGRLQGVLDSMDRGAAGEDLDVLVILRLKTYAKMAGVPFDLSLDQMHAILEARDAHFASLRRAPAEVDR